MPDRLRILEDEEIVALYGPPRFTPEEQRQYFSLTSREQKALEQLHSIKSRLFFLLQLGYFKARHQFFVFDLGRANNYSAIEQDATYLCQRYFPGLDLGELEITKVTRLRHQ